MGSLMYFDYIIVISYIYIYGATLFNIMKIALGSIMFIYIYMTTIKKTIIKMFDCKFDGDVKICCYAQTQAMVHAQKKDDDTTGARENCGCKIII
jgi:hypothetical protein